MKGLTHSFKSAARDYLYLLERNYPQKTMLKMVGDRYALSGNERTMLYRGLTIKENIINRKKKLVKAAGLENELLHIDGFNVIITLGSYLNGNLIFISNDHMLRDAAEIHGKVLRTDLLDRSIELVLSFLKDKGLKSVCFYFDSPVSKSKMLAEKINKLLEEKHIKGEAMVVPSPDTILKNLDSGIIATSDSTIIDQTSALILDLPLQVLMKAFNPVLTDLRGFSAKNH